MHKQGIGNHHNTKLQALVQAFDYIILGAGCAGLSLVTRLIESGKFNDKKILLLDRQQKKLNDRTWCFWEKEAGHFESLVYHQWKTLWVKHPKGSVDLNLDDYTYKMIRGIEFYNHCFSIIKKAANVTVRYEEVSAIDAEKGSVSAGENEFITDYIFSSVLLEMPLLAPTEFYLLQHFRGWWIDTDTDFFDPSQADLMNFKTSQVHGCAFVYVLPVSKRRALVEYTLFTEEPLQNEEYEAGIRTFIHDELKLSDYTTSEVEQGIIPMTNLHFPTQQGKVFFIGTAGGQTKASTGYTFRFIQKQSQAIVDSLVETGKPILPETPKRFHFYDSVLLRVLHERKLGGDELFYQMFKQNKASKVLKFLDNETSLIEELRIMNSTPKTIFVPAAMKEM